MASRIIRRLQSPHRVAFERPLPSEWYPEESLALTLQLLREETGSLRDERFVELMQAITGVGLNRFFKVVMQMASADFVLRRIPVMWDHIRRGGGRVDVDTTGAGALIRYAQFPYFGDENYRLLTQGSLQMLLLACGRAGDVKLGAATVDSLVVEIKYR